MAPFCTLILLHFSNGLTFGKLCRAAIEGLLKQVSSSFQLFASIAIDELGEVRVPDVIHIGPFEEGNATFIRLCQEKVIIESKS